MPEKTWIETLPYPKGLFKLLFKTPILLYRLGLGFLIGRLFMIMTTTGRKSGQPRRTAIEFHEFEGQPTVLSGWGERTDWYRNLQADPRATVQTWRGTAAVRARRIDTDEELRRAFDWAQSNPTMRWLMKLAGFALTAEQFLAARERFVLVTFEPTNEPTPPALEADLWWVWVMGAILLVLLTTRWHSWRKFISFA